jgi:hypothetical protein
MARGAVATRIEASAGPRDDAPKVPSSHGISVNPNRRNRVRRNRVRSKSTLRRSERNPRRRIIRTSSTGRPSLSRSSGSTPKAAAAGVVGAGTVRRIGATA